MPGNRRFEKWRAKPFQWALLVAAMGAAGLIAAAGPAQIGELILPGRPALTADAHKTVDAIDEKQILRAVEGAKSIKMAMKHPESFKLASMTIMTSGAVCYVYWAMNELGGTVKAAAVFNKDEIATLETQGFDLRWKDMCQGKAGKDATGFGELMVY